MTPTTPKVPKAPEEVTEGGLAWGRRVLMCSPEHFDVTYSINVWMDPDVRVDFDRAWRQWDDLVSTLETAGTEVRTVPAAPGLPDMVFTANAGIVDGTTVTPARMSRPERAPEVEHVGSRFEELGWTVERPPAAPQEGAGDAVAFAGGLVAGYGRRSSASAYDDLRTRNGWTVTALELPDPRYYHVDLGFCPLDERTAMVVPEAFNATGRAALAEIVEDPVVLTPDEAAAFCANAVVSGQTVVMPHCSPRLGRELERRGFEPAVCDVSEFGKAGGGCRCLTLALDVELDRAAAPSTVGVEG
ncbi:dimethylarginine dimethylaminohydrolase family protein [Amycolatopsis sp. YIM 10]|uniref:dimethylarginine dimethylaminohydrolase family protein n=1 Tax=Amycolatopsis sp. YIM 10 TaxID=2653857 RepID=UPI00128FE3FC|nr:amidinotransferase [Amycolatopsis sp. YIM 10]QFU92750.1 N(G),N(G)-dimethylarginine dimethylaminohydrolase [Amycolatopsis sp. YIM 10]